MVDLGQRATKNIRSIKNIKYPLNKFVVLQPFLLQHTDDPIWYANQGRKQKNVNSGEVGCGDTGATAIL